MALALAFALTDEVHQIFVKGRGFEIEDIGMDMLGMFLGYSMSLCLFYLVNLIKPKNAD